MGDALSVPLGTTAFVAGRTMWALLPPELKSVAVRARVVYAPHPYVWMGPTHAKSTRLGLECEGLEVELGALPQWEEAQRKTLPVVRNTPSLPPHTSDHADTYGSDRRVGVPGPPVRRRGAPH
jgi:hypothetical protein